MLSLVAIGAGAAAYAMTRDRRSRRRWKKRLDNANFLEEFALDDVIPNMREINRYRKRMMRTIT
ncbi:DUF3918 family protein [Alteribacter populi]|uniref:DUF3918 family protein n=1 Tax=Alteribacter populi TaxID=2011011 RepID=UPI0012FE6C68|nr:DUF3918 family protein [Alteribacter populi]